MNAPSVLAPKVEPISPGPSVLASLSKDVGDVTGVQLVADGGWIELGWKIPRQLRKMYCKLPEDCL
jgi:hypothetical protein